MALNWQGVTGNYGDILYGFLKQLEAPTQSERFNIELVNGNPTIGIGFDLRAGGAKVREVVFEAMGLRYDLVMSSDSELTAAQKKEKGYVNELISAVGSGASKATFNAIMLRRHNDTDPAYAAFLPVGQRRGSFTFNSEAEVRTTFDTLWVEKYRKDIYDKWPELKNDVAFASSRELLVIGSLTWNGGAGILGPNLRNALLTGSRAEAWFEIRYGSNAVGTEHVNGNRFTKDHKAQYDQGIDKGLAKRRYFESAVFGLYDKESSAEVPEAKLAFRMLTLHHDTILKYEAAYGDDGHGTIPDRGNQVTAAQTSYSGMPFPVKIETIEASFETSKNLLIDYLNKDAAYSDLNLVAANYLATDIYLDPGRISSRYAIDANHESILNARFKPDGKTESLADNILIGEGGWDTLIGGKGKDVLLGGNGIDVYVFKNADGKDTLLDKDGGYIVREGNYLRAGAEYIDETRWKSTGDGQKIYYEKVGDNILKVTFEGSSDEILIKNFDFQSAYRNFDSKEEFIWRFEGWKTFGITLSPPPIMALLPGWSPVNIPFIEEKHADLSASDLQTTTTTAMQEGTSEMFRAKGVSFDLISDANDNHATSPTHPAC